MPADLTPQLQLLGSSAPPGERWALLAVPAVTTLDTVNVAAFFSKVKSAVNVFSGPVTGVTLPTVTGTVVTFAQLGLALDTVFLLVLGDSA